MDYKTVSRQESLEYETSKGEDKALGPKMPTIWLFMGEVKSFWNTMAIALMVDELLYEDINYPGNKAAKAAGESVSFYTTLFEKKLRRCWNYWRKANKAAPAIESTLDRTDRIGSLRNQMAQRQRKTGRRVVVSLLIIDELKIIKFSTEN